MTELAALSARALAKAIRAKKVSSVEATAQAIERLRACHELTHAVITLEADEALAAAKAADAGVAAGTAKGALAGVPLAHKDMFDRKGRIASWGANIRAAEPATEDATAIARFKAAGALQIAALHLTEFAYGPTGHNYVLGHARNPWDPTRITGGSSAGTAAAGGLWRDPRRPRLRHRRIAARSCGVLRRRLHQADLGPHQPRRRHAAGAAARHGRLHRPARRGSGADARPARRDPTRAILPPPRLPVPDYVASLDDAGRRPQGRRRRDGDRRCAPGGAAHGARRCWRCSPSSG